VAHTFFWRGEFDRAIEFDVDDPAYVSVVALVVLGRREEAAVLSRRARAKANTHLLLEKAVTTGLHSTSALEASPTFGPLRSSPRFKALLDVARQHQLEAEKDVRGS
jgi:hypothetical protein